MSIDWQTLANHLFDGGHDVSANGDFLSGTGTLDGQAIAVAGTTGHAAVGVQLALAQARAVLDTVARHPGRPLLLLIDTQGQRLRRREELLGLNRAMAHLGKAIDFARRQGHPVLGLVYDQALSGGFITSGLIADACDALPGAEIYVMRLPAMARITKLPEAELRELSQSNPVFAPGAINYVRMGGIRQLWEGAPAEALRQALASLPHQDERAHDGASRGGRRMAEDVIQRVLDAA